MDIRTKTGRVGVAYAIKYYVDCNFTVSIPLDDTQWYDLIIEKNGIVEFVQCKATQTQHHFIDLRNTGGTNGKVYDPVFDHPVDRLFCVNRFREMFDIPVAELKKFNSNMLTFALNAKPSKNNQGFPSYKYYVK